MKNLEFYSGECVEIVNQEQYNQVRHMLRNPNMEHSNPFPIYFEHANSVSRGPSIGFTFNPVDTWSGKPLTVVHFEDAIR